MAASPTMNRPVLNFANGVPVEIALKYGTGKQTSNGRVMFSTVDGEVFFVDEFDADQIYALELRPQEPFRIMKRGGQILVERKRVEQPAIPAPAAPATVETAAQQIQQQPQSNTLSGIMASSYIAAVDALLIAKEYAEHKGVAFRMSPAELRACAHCLFIAATKQGVR